MAGRLEHVGGRQLRRRTHPPDTVERFIDTFGPRGFRRTTFAPAYGLAEATLSVTVKRAGTEPSFLHVDADALAESIVKESPRSERGTRTLVGCGEPLEETHVRIVNPTDSTRVPTRRGRRSVAGRSRDRHGILGANRKKLKPYLKPPCWIGRGSLFTDRRSGIPSSRRAVPDRTPQGPDHRPWTELLSP